MRVGAGVALVLLAAVLLAGLVRANVVDDSFIGARYAWNLVHGNGPVFNLGERVEGYSDPLWILLLTIPVSLGWPPEKFGIIVGILSGALAFATAYIAAVRHYGLRSLFALVVIVACMFDVDYWAMCTNGLESGLFSLLLTVSFVLWLERRWIAAGIAFGSLLLLRPEALVYAPLVALGTLAVRPASSRIRFGLEERRMLRMLVPWAVIAIVLFAFRIGYFHALLPNSVTAKSHPFSLHVTVLGVEYVSEFASSVALPLGLTLLLVFTGERVSACVTLLLVVAEMGVVVLNGGDWMAGFRLLDGSLPILALLSARALDILTEKRISLQLPAVLAFAAVTFLLHAATTDPHRTDWSWSGGLIALSKHSGFLGTRKDLLNEDTYAPIAEALAPELKASDIVSPEALGLFSYLVPDTRVHDFMGLTDRYVATHGTYFDPMFGKANPSYSVETVAPSVFVFHSGLEHPRRMESATHGDFLRKYVLLKAPDLVAPNGNSIWIAIRKDRYPELFPALQRAGIRTVEIPVL